jgi:hypothetical protein
VLALTVAFGALLGAAPARAAEPAPITIDDSNVFPESLTATASGDLIVGSSAKGTIYRAKAGAAKAEPWIDPKVSGMIGVFGVFADDRTRTLYACSLPFGAPREQADVLSALRAFDLRTGKPKASYPLPDGYNSLCNDIAVAKDGTVYVSETRQGRVLRLTPGASALEVWIKDPKFAAVDGIAIGGDGAVYVNTVATGHMFRIPVGADGAAGPPTELQPSLPLDHPDGLRALGGLTFLQSENGDQGRVAEVTIDGDKATITPLKSEPGVVSAVRAKGRIWTIDAKFAYRRDPALKGKDPNPFLIEPVPAPAR